MEDLQLQVSDRGDVDDWTEARDALRQWREEESRKSQRTVELGRFLLRKKSHLGNEGPST